VTLDPIVDTPPTQSEIGNSHSLPTPRIIALQNEDTCEDAIVITILETVPFCCHKDLPTMSRSQLAQGTTTLNARLPPSFVSTQTSIALTVSSETP
ncbi:hypothetical protein DFS33DRAFT_1363542, partial [Desarmillaria ectypa]